MAPQSVLSSGGWPDILALDSTGRVVVIKLKRDVDRHQLAQALQYAGWARTTNLDAVASLYYGGVASFWDDWMEFTATAQPVLVQRSPRLVLVARSFDARTASALDFPLQNNLPVQVLEVAFYIDASGRRILDVEWEAEPESTVPSAVPAVLVDAVEKVDFRGITLAQVAAAVNAPCELRWDRPRKGTVHTATLLEPGRIVLPDGSEHRSPSGAAMAAAEVASYDGWYAWRLPDGRTLNDVRHALAAQPV